MPETTLIFETDTLDRRVDMRGDLAWLRGHPRVTNVRRADAAPQTGRESWVVEHDDVSEFSSLQSERTLAVRLRGLRAVEDRDWEAEWRRRAERPLPPPDPDNLISRALATTEGRSALAASMIAPLRARRDYTSLGRQTFLVEQLPDGALPTYNRDPDPGAMVTITGVGGGGGGPRTSLVDTLAAVGREIANQGLTSQAIPMSQQTYQDLLAVMTENQRANLDNNIQAGRVTIPQFEIMSNPTINLADIRERRFDLMERHPPAPPPEWVGVGVYVRNKKDAEDLWVITGVDTYNVTMERWRGIYRTTTVAFASLTGTYEPCLAPTLPPSRFERELEI